MRRSVLTVEGGVPAEAGDLLVLGAARLARGAALRQDALQRHPALLAAALQGGGGSVNQSCSIASEHQ